MSNSQNAAGSLFAGAASAGVLSKAALQVITNGDLGEDINAALGVSVDDVTASQVILMTQIIDDSSSIRFVAGNTELVREGHNLVLDSLSGSKQKDGILAMSTTLNRGLVFPYCLIDNAQKLAARNYNPDGGTPLFDRAVEVLATVIAKCQDFQDNGISCRTITAFITDGGDSGSRHQAGDVKKIVADMLRAENHIIAGVGIWDGDKDSAGNPIPGTGTDFHQVFGGMGILPNWILTPNNNPKEIRAAFNMLSQSAVRASQVGGAAFSKAAMGGGFGTP